MKFVFSDDATMFNSKRLPNANNLRFLTLKLGKFLGIDKIKLINIRQITTRYIIDLNLPRESLLFKRFSRYNFKNLFF